MGWSGRARGVSPSRPGGDPAAEVRADLLRLGRTGSGGCQDGEARTAVGAGHGRATRTAALRPGFPGAHPVVARQRVIRRSSFAARGSAAAPGLIGTTVRAPELGHRRVSGLATGKATGPSAHTDASTGSNGSPPRGPTAGHVAPDSGAMRCTATRPRWTPRP